MKHTTVLHPPHSPSRLSNDSGIDVRVRENFGSNTISVQNHIIGASDHDSKNHSANEICLRTIPVRVRGKDLHEVIAAYALLDNGSDITLCDHKLPQHLGVEGKPRNVLTTQQKKDSPRYCLEVELSIESIQGDSSLKIPKAWTIDHLNISENSIPRPDDPNSWPHLSDIKFPELADKQVSLLIACHIPEAFWAMDEGCGS